MYSEASIFAPSSSQRVEMISIPQSALGKVSNQEILQFSSVQRIRYTFRKDAEVVSRFPVVCR